MNPLADQLTCHCSPHRKWVKTIDLLTRRVITLAILSAISYSSIQAQIQLDLQHGVGDEVILSWGGGIPTYNLYMGTSADLSGSDVQALLEGSSNTSHTVSAPGDLLIFRVGDTTAPQFIITTPLQPVTAAGVTVAGGTTAPANAVWVNGTVAQITPTSFMATEIPVAIGQTVVRVAGTSSDGNISVATHLVQRIIGNQPPTIDILSPQDNSEVWDVTPLITTVVDDDEFLESSNLRLYLDGVDRTANLTITTNPLGATWQIDSQDALAIGTHVLRATIRDLRGYTQAKSVQFRVSGPRIDNLTPTKALPLSTITINGDGFGTTTNTQVKFNGVTALSIVSITTNQISVQVPQGATDGEVTVTVDGVVSNSIPFDIAFNNVSPIPGTYGNIIAIDALDRVYYGDGIATNTIYRIEQNGSIALFFSSPDEINGMKFDPSGTKLYVSGRGAPIYDPDLEDPDNIIYFTGRIYEVDLNGNYSVKFTLDPFSTPRYADPGGIDVRPPYVYVGVVQPGLSNSIVRLDMNSPQSFPVNLINQPLSNWLYWDVQLDSVGNIYHVYSPPGVFYPQIFKNSLLMYEIVSDSPRGLSIDCLDRVYFTAGSSGRVLRLIGFQQSTTIATMGGEPTGIGIDSKGNIFVGVNNVVRAIGANATLSSCSTDYGGSISGAAAKLFADYNPHAPQTPSPDNQFIVLTACMDDPTVPHDATDLVYWTFEDIDDPATDVTIDPDLPPGVGDNLGHLDAADWFAAEPPFTLIPSVYGTNYDGNGCSKVQFHYSDGPGDNFIVSARFTTDIGDREFRTKPMTVWKTVYVEMDSMGQTYGSFEPDDAVLDDIPPPEPDFLQGLFAPAYIEIVYQGYGQITDVAFNYNVPQLYQGVAPSQLHQEIRDQGVLGRDSSSSTGMWSIYAQGAYEGPMDTDNDPDDPLGNTLVGITNGFYGRYSLVFVEPIRDWTHMWGGRDEAYMQKVVAAHELCHQFGLDDETVTNDGSYGIMEYRSLFAYPYLNAEHLRTIRVIAADPSTPYPSRVE